MRASVLGLIGAVVAGCGAPDVADYGQAYERAYCAWAVSCHEFAAVDDCVLARTIDDSYAYLAEAVAAGTAEYDAGSAQACLDALPAMSCADPQPEPPEACQAAFRGRIGKNGPCMNSLECAGDAVCGFDPNCADACCPGACRVFADPLEEGAACGGNVACADELYCGFDGNTGMATVCTPRVAVGGACSNGEACVEQAVCDGSRCVAFVEREEGEACDGLTDRCVAPTECRFVDVGTRDVAVVQRCVAPTGLGEPCDPQDFTSCARFDSYCHPGSGLCTLLPEPGAGCANGECAGSAVCERITTGVHAVDDASGTCVARGRLHERCGQIDSERYVQCLGELQCGEDLRCVLVDEPSSACPVPGA